MASDNTRKGTLEETNGRSGQGTSESTASGASAGSSSPQGNAASGSSSGTPIGAQEQQTGLGGIADKAQSAFGQMSDQMGSKLGPAMSQASDKAQDMAGQAADRMQDVFEQAPENVAEASNNMFEWLQHMGPRDYYYAASVSLGLSTLLLLFGRRSMASFVGLWSGIVLNLGLLSRLVREAEHPSSRQSR